MNNPFISVIIPVYNVEKYLHKCLVSVKNQTFKDFEIIIVNDASPDNSSQIIEYFKSENSDLKISILNLTQNQGISSARNHGLKIARGKYIYFLDSDDDITSDCFDILSKKAFEYPYDVVIGENFIISDNSQKKVALKIKSQTIENNDCINSYCRREWYNQVWNKLYRLDFLKSHDLKFASGHILEDELWSFQIAALAKKISFVKKCTYNYYIRPKSIISTIKGNSHRWFAFLKINKLIRDEILKYNLAINPYVGKYFLENLLVTITGFHSCNALNSELLNDIVRLNIMSPYKLFKQNQLSIKECIAYSFLNLPPVLSHCWYKLLPHK